MGHEEIIYDILTKETTTRPYTKEEIEETKIEQAKRDAEKIAAAENEEKKAALLSKLGITEDEARLLLS
jgi:hypothetical protein